MTECSLIANSGIQMFVFRLKLNTQEKFKMWFYEQYDAESARWCLDLAHELFTDDNTFYYLKKRLHDDGFLGDDVDNITPSELRDNGIEPIRIDDEMCDGVEGNMYKMTFTDRNNVLKSFENKWLPLPYFFKRTETLFRFEPYNWARIKLVPREGASSELEYDAILAFDTRAGYVGNEYKEFPVFPDVYCSEMKFELCSNEFFLMDYCASGKKWSYVDEHIFKLVYPKLTDLSQVRSNGNIKMSYVASYIFLINYLAKKKLLPKVTLYKDHGVRVKSVDMVVDIGNSRTTALLIEDNTNFNQVKPLRLMDYSNLIAEKDEGVELNNYSEPFDMRLAFRKVNFGMFGVSDSLQFVYPSFVRLGQEANVLIHKACESQLQEETLSTYSSPKRYLWDSRLSQKEWRFLVLPEEKDSEILRINGVSKYLTSDGKYDETGNSGGRSSHYSRRSLMTFAFLEMLSQAITQINSESFRSDFGSKSTPRKIRRIIITCPTAMSKLEREALVKCAKDAVSLYGKFAYTDREFDIEIIPTVGSRRDDEGLWYYDEATCAQLVYIYGEIGYKYKGVCSEFFNLYGKKKDGDSQATLTVGSLDIGAGTSDLMISEYSYEKSDVTTIIPDPKFYDSFYYAGDEVLNALIKNVMLLDERYSSFRKALAHLDFRQYQQKIKDFFGPDHAFQTVAERIARRDFNIQYSVPLMSYFLELASKGSGNCVVKYKDVFEAMPPNERIIEDFKNRVGIDITTLEWVYDKDFVSDVISKELEPLLKKISAIFYAYSCDVILLSGRPASLPAIRNIFLKYYPVSPNRLIKLNNYYVGDWYPFCKNTGYITNPKTIVAMGGVIGHYASEFSNLDRFIINLDKLKSNLKSTVDYIEASRDGQPIEYLITPEKRSGELVVSRMPDVLYVRQIGLTTYPSRALYTIDFNYSRMLNKVRNKVIESGENLSDSAIQALAYEEIDNLKKRMPYKITIERDNDDKENLSITTIEDKYGNEMADSAVEVHIQSLGAEDMYWLDSGVFDF